MFETFCILRWHSHNTCKLHTYIFIKLKQSNKQTNINQNTDASNSMSRSRKKNGSFFVPFLVAVTFVLFIFLPNQIWFYSNVLKVNNTPVISKIEVFCSVMYYLGFISHSIIYIFLSPITRRVVHILLYVYQYVIG